MNVAIETMIPCLFGVLTVLDKDQAIKRSTGDWLIDWLTDWMTATPSDPCPLATSTNSLLLFCGMARSIPEKSIFIQLTHALIHTFYSSKLTRSYISKNPYHLFDEPPQARATRVSPGARVRWRWVLLAWAPWEPSLPKTLPRSDNNNNNNNNNNNTTLLAVGLPPLKATLSPASDNMHLFTHPFHMQMHPLHTHLSTSPFNPPPRHLQDGLASMVVFNATLPGKYNHFQYKPNTITFNAHQIHP